MNSKQARNLQGKYVFAKKDKILGKILNYKGKRNKVHVWSVRCEDSGYIAVGGMKDLDGYILDVDPKTIRLIYGD